jgi:succinate dehydrogenase / fumarate reductase, cytochrome b subunit
LSTAATAPDLTHAADAGIAGRHHFLLRRLHSLTGIVFGGYLVVHLLINATIAQGGNVYQTQVDKIHDLPFLPVIEWTFIYLPILFHTAYGIWITVNGQWNATRYPYEKNYFYVLQRISAIVIVFFMLFHILSLKYGLFGANLAFNPHRGALQTVAQHMEKSFFITWLVYPIGIAASCFHLANGFWTAAITWGLTISKRAQRRWGVVCLGLFVLTFVAGMIALAAAARLDPTTVPLGPDVH